MTLVDKLDAIGDAIRAKTGKSAKMTLDEMPQEIAGISGGGGFLYSQIKLVSNASIFRDTASLTMDGLSMKGTISISYMFGGLTNLVSVDFAGMVDVDDINSAQRVFYNCSKLISVDMSDLIMPRLTDCNAMFNGCSSIESVRMPTTGTMSRLIETFKGCSALTDIDMTGVSSSSSVDAGDMLTGCTSLKTLRMGSGWVNGSSYYARFPVAMQDENGTSYAANAKIPNGAHTYTAV